MQKASEVGTVEVLSPTTAESVVVRKPELEADVKSIPSGNESPPNGQHDLEKSVGQDGDATSTPKKLPRWRMVILMLALASVNFISALSLLVLTTSLPTIAKSWNASDSDFAWIASADLLGVLATIPLWARLSDVFGRKPVLIAANGVFLLGDIIAGTSRSLGMLVAGRVAQGLGNGGIFTLVNVCIGDLFSVRERALHYGVVGAVWATALAFGPIIGGIITSTTTWRWCFYINLPFDITAVVLLIAFLDIHNPKTPIKQGLLAIDWLGAITFAGAAIILMFGLQSGGVSYPWGSPTVILLIVFGLVTFCVFGLVQKKFAKYPVMPLEVFKSSHIILTLFICFTQSANAVVNIMYLPIYYQVILGKTPILSALYFLPFALMLGVFSIGTGIIIRKWGNYTWPIRIGSAMITLGMGLYINLGTSINWPNIIISQLIAAAGVGLLHQAPMIAFQAAIKQKDLATGQSTFQVTRTFSQGIAIVIGQVLFQSQVQDTVKNLKDVPSELIASLQAGNVIAMSNDINDMPMVQRTAIREALALSLRRMWIYFTAAALAGFIASLFLKDLTLSTVHEVVEPGLSDNEVDGQAGAKSEGSEVLKA